MAKEIISASLPEEKLRKLDTFAKNYKSRSEAVEVLIDTIDQKKEDKMEKQRKLLLDIAYLIVEALS